MALAGALVTHLADGLQHVAEAASLLDQADYVFADNEPDSALWAKLGDLSPAVVNGVGLVIADPNHVSSLLYVHTTAFLNSTDTATLRAHVKIQPIPDTSPAFLDNTIGFRLGLDDGLHRVTLRLARDNVTGERRVWVEGASGISESIPFSWDDNGINVYQIDRLAGGDMLVTLVGGTTGVTVSRLYPAISLPSTYGSPRFEWGTADIGGGTTVWREVHAEVRGEAFVPVITYIDPQTINKKAKGRYITAYVELPAGSRYSPSDIDLNSVTLQAIAPVTSSGIHIVSWAPSEIGDGIANGVPDLMLKFDPATVQSWFLTATPATFRVEGQLFDGSMFRSDNGLIQIIDVGTEHESESGASVRK